MDININEYQIEKKINLYKAITPTMHMSIAIVRIQ